MTTVYANSPNSIKVPAFAPDHLSCDRPEISALDLSAAGPVREALRAGWEIEAREIGLLRTGGTSAANHWIDGAFVLKRRPDAVALADEVARLRLAGTAGVAVPSLRQPRRTASGCIHVDANGAWALFDFVAGSHFRGMPGEMGLASRSFDAVARAFAAERAPGSFDWNAVPRRLVAALAAPAKVPDAEAEEILATHRTALATALAEDGGRDLGPLETLHTDLHPMNLLFAHGQAVVLDFEDVGPAPRVVAAGFALLKLGREALSRTLADARGARARELLFEWFGQAPLDVGAFRIGARRRILANIAHVLELWRLGGDRSANKGLARQLNSLAETEFLFDHTLRGACT